MLWALKMKCFREKKIRNTKTTRRITRKPFSQRGGMMKGKERTLDLTKDETAYKINKILILFLWCSGLCKTQSKA